MRIADVDFILVPEWLAAPDTPPANEDHWISRWERNFATASWLDVSAKSPGEALVHQAAKSKRPVVVITHGRGIDVLLDVREALGGLPVIGAFLVAPATSHKLPFLDGKLTDPVAFQSLIVASDDHPECPQEEARRLAEALGGHFVAAGSTQRLDAESGQGPWPEGLMRLGWFLKQLRQH